ncbi:MAG: hypothetical protein PVG55_04975 [Nitrospirota bacterium]|jgi:hypothetical protein
MNCGREPGGRNNGSKAVCPAATDTRLDGVHGGKNAGRACWALGGTLCEGRPNGDFARRFKSCHACGFFKAVVREEGAGFVFTVTLQELLARASQPPEDRRAERAY